jgi:AraC-like DNA-binding protein
MKRKKPGRLKGSALRDEFVRRVAPGCGFEALFDQLPGVSFFAKNKDCRIVAANRHFFRRFGFSCEAGIIGKDDFDMFPRRLAEHFREDDQEVMRTGKPKLNIVELFFNQQGIPDWFITNKLPVRDRTGKVIGIMGTTQSYEGKKEVLLPYLQIDRAVAFIRENFRKRISVEELSAMVHLSSRQLHRKFVETFGSSPQAFIMKLRIQAACEALQHDDTPIGVVARDLGFGDQSAFTQHFHKHIGLTPLRYQRQFRLRRG